MSPNGPQGGAHWKCLTWRVECQSLGEMIQSGYMAEKDITKIRVGQFEVGIIGIKRLLAEMSEEYSFGSDGELSQHMLRELAKDNYIPEGAKNEYAKAFVREFRKFMGQPYEPASTQGLDIKVLGPGCTQCDRLEQTLMAIVSELGLAASIEHVKDMKEIAKYRVMGLPALAINGKVVAKGSVPAKAKLARWLTEAAAG